MRNISTVMCSQQSSRQRYLLVTSSNLGYFYSPRLDVFKGGWVGGSEHKHQFDVSRGNMNMDAFPKMILFEISNREYKQKTKLDPL